MKLNEMFSSILFPLLKESSAAKEVAYHLRIAIMATGGVEVTETEGHHFSGCAPPRAVEK